MSFCAVVETTNPTTHMVDRWECEHVHRGYEQAVKCALAEAKRVIPSTKDMNRYGVPVYTLFAGADHIIPHTHS